MKVKINCSDCQATGHVMNYDPYSNIEIDCPYCGGIGYRTMDIIGSELDDIMSVCKSILESVEKIKIK
jgi:hypothetical protein